MMFPSRNDDRRAELLSVLATHQPATPRENRSLERIGAFLRWLPHPFDESADPTHVTASAIVWDDDRVVLHRHRRLGLWLQPGGHLDPGETPEEAARREVEEETGLATRHPEEGPQLVHVDVHEGGRGHLHLDLRYLLLPISDRHFDPAADESREVAWFHHERAMDMTDRSAADAIFAAGKHSIHTRG